jgi:hypothetical protein
MNMKKTLLLLAISISLFSCGNSNSKGTKETANDTAKSATQGLKVTGDDSVNKGKPQKSLMFDCCPSIAVQDPNTMIEYRKANPQMLGYSNDYQSGVPIKKYPQYAFYFPIDNNFKTYLQEAMNNHAAAFHFILANDRNSLSLLLSGVDQYLNHIYNKCTTATGYQSGFKTYWLFKNESSDALYYAQDVTPIVLPIKSSAIQGTYATQKILATDALSWIKNYYYNVNNKCNDTCSYIFPSDV